MEGQTGEDCKTIFDFMTRSYATPLTVAEFCEFAHSLLGIARLSVRTSLGEEIYWQKTI
jgi:hypothetical protein